MLTKVDTNAISAEKIFAPGSLQKAYGIVVSALTSFITDV